MAISNDTQTAEQHDDHDTDLDLETELERIDGNVNGLYTLISDLRDRVKELEEENERQRTMLQSLQTRVAEPITDGESE